MSGNNTKNSIDKGSVENYERKLKEKYKNLEEELNNAFKGYTIYVNDGGYPPGSVSVGIKGRYDRLNTLYNPETDTFQYTGDLFINKALLEKIIRNRVGVFKRRKALLSHYTNPNNSGSSSSSSGGRRSHRTKKRITRRRLYTKRNRRN